DGDAHGYSAPGGSAGSNWCSASSNTTSAGPSISTTSGRRVRRTSVSEFAAALNSIAKTRGISWPSTNTCPRLCAVITIFTSAIAQPRHGDDRRLATIVGRANALDVVRLALVDNAPRRIDFARPDVEPHLLAVGLGTGCDGLGGRAQGVRHLRPHLAVVA